MKSARVLLANAIDYAGLFPPAGLAMREAVGNYQRYRGGAECGLLGRFVVPQAQAAETGLPSDRLSVLAQLSGVTAAGCYEVKGSPVDAAITPGAIVYFEVPFGEARGSESERARERRSAPEGSPPR